MVKCWLKLHLQKHCQYYIMFINNTVLLHRLCGLLAQLRCWLCGVWFSGRANYKTCFSVFWWKLNNVDRAEITAQLTIIWSINLIYLSIFMSALVVPLPLSSEIWMWRYYCITFYLNTNFSCSFKAVQLILIFKDKFKKTLLVWALF